MRRNGFRDFFLRGFRRLGGVADDFVDDFVAATRSSIKSMVNPLLRNAISCSRRATVSKS